MSVGLIGLLDDIAGIAKVAAASLDDVASQAAKAGAKAAGVVIDDTAVTPGYVIGFEPKRELPIVGKIAAGSLRNKLLILLPAALVLSYFLPWTITPLLMPLRAGFFLWHGRSEMKEAAEAVPCASPGFVSETVTMISMFATVRSPRFRGDHRALSRRFQLTGNPAGRDRVHRVLDDRVCEAVVAVPALERAELEALRARRNPHQHHAAFAFRTSGPADRKQARFGSWI